MSEHDNPTVSQAVNAVETPGDPWEGRDRSKLDEADFVLMFHDKMKHRYIHKDDVARMTKLGMAVVKKDETPKPEPTLTKPIGAPAEGTPGLPMEETKKRGRPFGSRNKG